MHSYARYAAPGLFLLFCATLAPWAFDFPLNDDWAYALAARALAETGRLTLSDWGSSTQLPHIVAGALSAKIFGFSFNALRLATLLSAAGAVFFFVKILDGLEIPPFEKMAAALALALNPLFLVLANSFMTDCHYLLWMLASSYFYMRNLKNPADSRALWLAGACAAAGYLTRQLAVALPLAFTLMLYFRGKPKWRELAAVWALPAAAVLGYYLWFRFSHGPTWAAENYVGAATLGHLSRPGPFLADSFYRVFASVLQSSLLLLPLAAGFAFSARQFWGKNALQRRLSPALPWLALAGLAVFALANGPLPYLENNLSRSGIGVLTVGGAALKPAGLFGSPLFWQAGAAVAVAAGALLVSASALALRAGPPGLRFLFTAALLQLGISLVGAKFFDRYLLVLLPWFAAAAAYAARGVRFSRPAAAAGLGLIALLGWAGMKDYLAWNKAKWELADRPRAALAREEIANGFDYEAWLTYERNMAYLKSMKPLKMIGEWEWQSRNTYRAMVSYAADPRLKVIDKAEYSTPLSSSKGVLYLLSLEQQPDK
jgi:hypothetical protein